MNHNPHHRPLSHHIIIGWVLFAVLIALYMMLYSARIQSGDTLRLFDVATSTARHHDTLRDETAWFLPPENYDPSATYPLDAEIITAPLIHTMLVFFYQFLDALPINIGFVHGLWTFNIIITALTTILLYSLLINLRQTITVALLTSLAFATLTLALPYTRTLFRESLVMPFLLVALLAITRFHHSHTPLYQRLLWLLVAALSYWLATQTKSSAILALPALIAYLMPTRIFRLPYVSATLLLLGTLTLVLFAYVPAVSNQILPLLQPLITRVGQGADYAQVALHTYLFSVGGSLWGTSPILLMGIPGAIYLWRDGQQRLVWVIWLMLVSYAFGHAITTNEHWFGGVSWPPRFLLPVIPIAIILITPIFHTYQRKPSARPYLSLPILALLAYTLIIQYSAISLPWTHYADVLPAGANRLIEWSDGLNNAAYLRWFLLPPSVANLGYDIAWLRADQPHWMLLYAILVGVGGAALIRYHCRPTFNRYWALMPVLTLSLMLLSLADLYQHDPLYLMDEPAMHEVNAILQQQSDNPAPLIILSRLHSQFFMNAYDRQNPRPIALPPQPGEPRDQPDAISSANTLNLLDYRTIRQLEHSQAHFETLWLLTDLSVFTPDARRVVENYLVERAYLVAQYTTTDPNVRLLRFDTTLSPRPDLFVDYEIPLNINFDDAAQLLGATLPQGLTYHPGDTLPITLFWQALQTDAPNYNVALFLAHPDALIPPIQGIDSPPQAGFSPINTWHVGQNTADNRALQLPPDMPQGTYQLWVILYHTTDDGIRRADVTMPAPQSPTRDNIAILPIPIIIAP